MLFNYGSTLGFIAICCSGATAHLAPFVPRSNRNATTSSTLTSLSSTTTHRNSTTTSSASTTSSSSSTTCQPVTTDFFGSECISYCGLATSFSFAPNVTETITVTLFGNSTTIRNPEETMSPTLPPQPCPTIETETLTATGTEIPTSPGTGGNPTLTVEYITSKTTVTTFASLPTPGFGSSEAQVKISASVNEPGQSANGGATGGATGGITPVSPLSVGPIQIQGPPQSQNNPSTPTPTIVDGVKVAVGSSVAVVNGATYVIGSGASPTTTVVNGQTISIGSNGVAIGGTTLTPGYGNAPGTQVATINGLTLTEIGSTLLLGTQTFAVGPGATPTTVVISGQTYSIGPNGVGTPSTTLFPSQQQYPGPTKVVTADGLTFSEIGSTLVVIGSQTFTVGPGALPTTDVVGSVTVSLGPGGVAVGSTTLAAPFGPATLTTNGGERTLGSIIGGRWSVLVLGTSVGLWLGI